MPVLQKNRSDNPIINTETFFMILNLKVFLKFGH